MSHRRERRCAVEVVEAFAARIEGHDGPLNAVVVRCFDEAIEHARASERRLRSDEAVGPLEGVPVTSKEAIAVAGLSWTSGSRLSSGAVASRDAGAVRRLRRAGAIVIGKTNVPEFCCWYDTDTTSTAGSVPCGTDGAGLPQAVQVIGRRGCDGDVLEAARHLELALGGAVTPPDRSRHARAEGGIGSERA